MSWDAHSKEESHLRSGKWRYNTPQLHTVELIGMRHSVVNLGEFWEDVGQLFLQLHVKCTGSNQDFVRVDGGGATLKGLRKYTLLRILST